MLALAEYQRHICDCGLHESIADTDPHIKTVRRICPTCKGLAINGRVQDALDEQELKKLGDNPPPTAPRPTDGRHEWNRLKTPTEIEASKASLGTPADTRGE